MIAPYEKYQAGGNDTLQIVVTTACDLYTCSNCTQLLPFRRDYRHMAVEVFRRALQLTADWPGVIGIFGGNPCSHPDFPLLCDLLEQYVPEQRRRGLWTNHLLNDDNGRAAHVCFYPHGRFNLNAHANPIAGELFEKWLPGKVIPESLTRPASHGPILMSHKDLPMARDAWPLLREQCDINRNWSGAVVERDGEAYGYFCEVAAALDGIRGTNHGVYLHYGWWQESMAAFQKQVWGCCDAGCGVPFKFKGHLDRADTYDITESFVPFTTLKKPVVCLDLHRDTIADSLRIIPESTDYMKVRA